MLLFYNKMLRTCFEFNAIWVFIPRSTWYVLFSQVCLFTVKYVLSWVTSLLFLVVTPTCSGLFVCFFFVMFTFPVASPPGGEHTSLRTLFILPQERGILSCPFGLISLSNRNVSRGICCPYLFGSCSLVFFSSHLFFYFFFLFCLRFPISFSVYGLLVCAYVVSVASNTMPGHCIVYLYSITMLYLGCRVIPR